MKITYDPDADAIYIQFANRNISHSVEIGDGVTYDVDENDNFIGLEIIDASKKFKTSYDRINFIRYPSRIKKKEVEA